MLYLLLPLGHVLKAWFLSQLVEIKIYFSHNTGLDSLQPSDSGHCKTWGFLPLSGCRKFCSSSLSSVSSYLHQLLNSEADLGPFAVLDLHSFPRAKFSFLKKEVRLEAMKVLILTLFFQRLFPGRFGGLGSLRKQIPSCSVAGAVSLSVTMSKQGNHLLAVCSF